MKPSAKQAAEVETALSGGPVIVDIFKLKGRMVWEITLSCGCTFQERKRSRIALDIGWHGHPTCDGFQWWTDSIVTWIKNPLPVQPAA
jgi:hypothetical protein